MKKVAKLDIFGQKWQVVTGKLSPNEAGLCEYGKMRIVINQDIPVGSNLWLETLCHEIFHSSFERCSYKQSGLPHELEEVMIDQLAKILTENRKILKKLF
jgi:hypothetical protein